MKELHDGANKAAVQSILSLTAEPSLLAQLIDNFPYPIQIFSFDGTSLLINKASLDLIGIRSVASHVGIYNVFTDPVVRKLGFTDKIKQVLAGKTVHIADFNAPYQDLVRHFQVVERDIQTISSDITCFPLTSPAGTVSCFAAVFIIKKIYRGKEEIQKGRQYIETHWLEKFDAAETARAACLSKAHFAKLFKKHMGATPHEYYINVKIEKLKEKLLDDNLSIARAFADCNIDYNGYYARLFREHTGLSPSEFRSVQAGQTGTTPEPSCPP
ncbi:MAG: helix-turn-helix transcriptional regulator [Clostridiales bacterium]|nr:helix-turn-helix transcriptional regulator [Clostridiales bacterium]